MSHACETANCSFTGITHISEKDFQMLVADKAMYSRHIVHSDFIWDFGKLPFPFLYKASKMASKWPNKFTGALGRIYQQQGKK